MNLGPELYGDELNICYAHLWFPSLESKAASLDCPWTYIHCCYNIFLAVKVKHHEVFGKIPDPYVVVVVTGNRLNVMCHHSFYGILCVEFSHVLITDNIKWVHVHLQVEASRVIDLAGGHAWSSQCHDTLPSCKVRENITCNATQIYDFRSCWKA